MQCECGRQSDRGGVGVSIVDRQIHVDMLSTRWSIMIPTMRQQLLRKMLSDVQVALSCFVLSIFLSFVCFVFVFVFCFLLRCAARFCPCFPGEPDDASGNRPL